MLQPDHGQLLSIIERIERLNEDKAAIADHIKEVLAEAKSSGYDTKAINKLVAMRKKSPQELAEEEAILETYRQAVGV